jgi:hypothetical protein
VFSHDLQTIGFSEHFHASSNDWLLLFTAHIGKIIEKRNSLEQKIIYLVGIYEYPPIAIRMLFESYGFEPREAQRYVLDVWADFESELIWHNYVERSVFYPMYSNNDGIERGD